MKPLRILFVSCLLLFAIACEDEETIPSPSPPPGTVNEQGIITGAYNINRFEQDGVENLELKDQFMEFFKDGSVTIHGRNYLYEGRWSYNEDKEYLDINIPGSAIQAVAVTSSSWVIVTINPDMLILMSREGGTVKRLELNKRSAGTGNGMTPG